MDILFDYGGILGYANSPAVDVTDQTLFEPGNAFILPKKYLNSFYQLLWCLVPDEVRSVLRPQNCKYITDPLNILRL